MLSKHEEKNILQTVGAGFFFKTCLNLSSPNRFAGANWFSEVRTTTATADMTPLSQTTTKATFSANKSRYFYYIADPDLDWIRINLSQYR
jgi:hypothetical protein